MYVLCGNGEWFIHTFVRIPGHITYFAPTGINVRFNVAKCIRKMDENHSHPYLNTMRSSSRHAMAECCAEFARLHNIRRMNNLWGSNEDVDMEKQEVRHMMRTLDMRSYQLEIAYNSGRGNNCSKYRSNEDLLRAVARDTKITPAVGFVCDTFWHLTSDEITRVLALNKMTVGNFKANRGSEGRWNQIAMKSDDHWQELSRDMHEEAVAKARANATEDAPMMSVDTKEIAKKVDKLRKEHEAACQESEITCDNHRRFQERIKGGDDYDHGHYRFYVGDKFSVRMNDGKVYTVNRLKVNVDVLDTQIKERVEKDLYSNEAFYAFVHTPDVLVASHEASVLFAANDKEPPLRAVTGLKCKLVMHKATGLPSHIDVPSVSLTGRMEKMSDKRMNMVMLAATNMRQSKNKSVLTSYFADEVSGDPNPVFTMNVLIEATNVYHAYMAKSDSLILTPGYFGALKYHALYWLGATTAAMTTFMYRTIDIVPTDEYNYTAVSENLRMAHAPADHGNSHSAGDAAVFPPVHVGASSAAGNEREAVGGKRGQSVEGKNIGRGAADSGGSWRTKGGDCTAREAPASVGKGKGTAPGVNNRAVRREGLQPIAEGDEGTDQVQQKFNVGVTAMLRQYPTQGSAPLCVTRKDVVERCSAFGSNNTVGERPCGDGVVIQETARDEEKPGGGEKACGGVGFDEWFETVGQHAGKETNRDAGGESGTSPEVGLALFR